VGATTLRAVKRLLPLAVLSTLFLAGCGGASEADLRACSEALAASRTFDREFRPGPRADIYHDEFSKRVLAASKLTENEELVNALADIAIAEALKGSQMRQGKPVDPGRVFTAELERICADLEG
jgi:hypothetical protein